MSIENFRTGNPDLHYSGYPGSEFPHQCGGGYGYGGYGQYGTYGSCATYDHYNADKVDYNALGAGACGTAPEAPIASDCNVAPAKPYTGPCGCGSPKCGAESFVGASDGHCNPGCAKPAWWGETSCRLPPKHCGAGSCGYFGADGKLKTHGHDVIDDAMKEGFCGGGACGGNPYDSNAHNYGPGELPASPPGDGCSATFDAQHSPGCTCPKCQMPYSAPYHVGPGCGAPACRCGECSGECNCAGKGPVVAASAGGLQLPLLGGGGDLTRNLVIALILAFLAYRFFLRK